MNTLMKFGIKLVAIIILLALLLSVLVLIYKQKGLFLPFATDSKKESPETFASRSKDLNCIFENHIKLTGGNYNDKTLPHPSY